jgi:hypothetical protein
MNLFRSDEHVARFNEMHGLEPGLTMTAAKMCEVSNEWWGNRLSPAWQPRTREESQAILDRLGLMGPFWQLR